MTVDELIANFRQALRALVPSVERAGIPWRRPDAYDEWDSLAAATYDALVAKPLRWSLPEPGQATFRLPKYDLLLESYAGLSVIEVGPPGGERLRVFHALGTKDEPFDLVEWRSVSIDGSPLSKTLETSPLAQTHFVLRHLPHSR